MINTSLHEQVYHWEIEQQVFQDILGCLDHVKPLFVTRSHFNESYRENFLVKTWEDQSGEHFDLYLPDDLQYIELLRFIDVLNQKFDIEKYARFEELLVSTKVAVAKFLKDWWSNETIEQYTKQSWISSELQGKIENIDLRKNAPIVRDVLYKNKKGASLEQVLVDVYWEEFEKTFFRRGVNILRQWLMAFTQYDASDLDTKDNHITEREKRILLDKEERKLRDAVGIEELKSKIQEAKSDGDSLRISQAQLHAVRRIFNELHKFPYQLNNGEQSSPWNPSEIIKTKEIFCVWFSIIAHAFFEELWIEHLTVSEPYHIYLIVHIWWKDYRFDASVNEDFDSQQEGYEFIVDTSWNIEGWLDFYDDEYVFEDAEEELFSSLKRNYFNDLKDKSQETEAGDLISLQKRLAISPEDPYIYAKIWEVFKKQKQYALASKYFFVTKTMIMWWRSLVLNKHKKKIKKMIQISDFKWVCRYLFELEKSLLSKK